MKFIFMTLMVLVSVCAPGWLQAADESPPVIKSIRVFRSGDNLGVEINADKNFEYNCTKMPQLLRVVIDLPRTEPGRPDTVYRYKSAMISTIRLEKKTINDVMITRVCVDLTEDAEFTTRVDDSDNKKVTFLFKRPAPGSTGGKAAAMPGNRAQGEPAVGKPAAPVATAPKSVSKPVVPGSNQPVTITGVDWGADSIEIKSSGNISEFKAFTLQQPGRLVIDIPGAHSTLRSIDIPANLSGDLKARIGLFEGRLRIVFDTGAKPFLHYDVVETGTGLRIVSRALTEKRQAKFEKDSRGAAAGSGMRP